MTTNNQPWTPEPWRWVERGKRIEPSPSVWADGYLALLGAQDTEVLGEWAAYADDSGLEITQPDAERIVECVNAMASVRPKTTGASVKALIEAAQRAYDMLRSEAHDQRLQLPTTDALGDALAQWEVLE